MRTAFKSASAVAILTGALTAANMNDAQASTIIDFESLNGPQAQGTDAFFPSSPYQESGFTLTNANLNLFSAWQDQGIGYTGSIALAAASNDISTLTKNDGNEFTVHSIDVAQDSFAPSVISDFTAQILGTTATGDTLSHTCNVFINQPIQTCQLPADFTVASLGIIQGTGNAGSYQFDNINISSVPVPASALLFGSGLIGLAGVARRKTLAPEIT